MRSYKQSVTSLMLSKYQEPRGKSKDSGGYRKGAESKGKNSGMRSSTFPREILKKSGKERTRALGCHSYPPWSNFSDGGRAAGPLAIKPVYIGPRSQHVLWIGGGAWLLSST